MEEYIRHKRRNQRIKTWVNKIYIPIPLSTKNQFAKMAREERFSQAELGAIIIMHFLEVPTLLYSAIDKYRKCQHKERLEELGRIKNEAEKPFDRTFGGLFKSTFPEDEK